MTKIDIESVQNYPLVMTNNALAGRKSIARHGRENLLSDHAPLVIDIDSPGYPFDAGWASADSRIAARLEKQR
jgi:hypothetical protein